MVEEIIIDSDERRRLITEDSYETPKYTYFALDAAVQYSGTNQKNVVGDIESIYKEFEEENPKGSFKDWKQFYLKNYRGESRLEDATEEAYSMFLKLRESIEQIDQSDMRDYIEELVLNKTYGQQNPQEAIAKKLVEDSSFEFDCTDGDPESDMVDITYQGLQVVIKPESVSEEIDKSEPANDRLLLFYEEKEDGQIRVDLSNLNRNLNDF